MKILSVGEWSMKREVDYGTPEQQQAVRDVIADVRARGDEAVRDFTKRFDGVVLDGLRVPDEEFEAAYEKVSVEFVDAIRAAATNIRSFHERQKRQSWIDLQPNGSMLGQLIRPLERVGLYVPGGTASYPSSVLMNAIPAQVAGVEKIVMVTPPGKNGESMNPHILVAANEVGIREVYQVGGAQAVAALAYGTESIPAVDKIVGPGNIYVALAKREVFGTVSIDMIAGPTDIAIVADESADPLYAAVDLLAQAEHDVLSPVTLITPSRELAEKVQAEVARQLEKMPRKAIAEVAIRDRGTIVVVRDLDEALDVLNQVAPEHCELLVKDPMNALTKIKHAGAVFLGPYTPEPVGDYFAGPNHVLPTNGTARFSSSLNVDDFIKKTSVLMYSKEALLQNGKQIITLAQCEGLHGHAEAVRVRLEKEGNGQ